MMRLCFGFIAFFVLGYGHSLVNFQSNEQSCSRCRKCQGVHFYRSQNLEFIALWFLHQRSIIVYWSIVFMSFFEMIVMIRECDATSESLAWSFFCSVKPDSITFCLSEASKEVQR